MTAAYVQTAKNKPCLEFLRRIGIHCNTDDMTFSWDTKQEFELPTHIRLVTRVAAETAA